MGPYRNEWVDWLDFPHSIVARQEKLFRTARHSTITVQLLKVKLSHFNAWADTQEMAPLQNR